MRIASAPAHVRRPRCPGLTLVELMVAVSVLSLIVLVLFRIFDQTQKALRANVAQVDVLEGGRAIMDLLRRDLEAAVARGGTTNSVNFFVRLISFGPRVKLPGDADLYATNEFDEIYFLTPNRATAANQTWDATVYRVLSRSMPLGNPNYQTNYSKEGVGWLARRTLTVDTLLTNSTTLMDAAIDNPRHVFEQSTAYTFGVINDADWVQFSRVADGVVHFKVTPLDSQGQPLHFAFLGLDDGTPDEVAYGPEVRYGIRSVDGERALEYFFLRSTLPASVSVEVGILEPQVTERLRSLPNLEAQARFLEEQAASIHYFQQRIPLPSAPKLLPR